MSTFTIEMECGPDRHWSIVGSDRLQHVAIAYCRDYAKMFAGNHFRVRHAATHETVFALKPLLERVKT